MTADAELHIRPLRDDDSVAALTGLLHRAYAPLGAAGLNFTAVDQSEAMTRERLFGALCWVAEQGGALVGSVTASGVYDPNTKPWARATPWFYRTDVAHLHQLAVEPARQGAGIGARLMAACEAWARDTGHRAIALDTAAPAAHLRARYTHMGYADVDEVQWAGKTYRSVVMAKPLPGHAAPRTDDIEHHAALVRALWAGFQARDWAGARRWLADDAQLHWLASGEHLLDADAIIRVNALYPEGWHLSVREVTPMADGRVHSVIEVTHDGRRFFANTLWRFRGDRIAGADEYWGSCETPPAWRTADAIGAYRRDPV
ncbi:GNAT family N-acetyltransferase [Ideonella sp. A 288]|uniref:GNAT family N-acetyltransferase n=1 Tax=Ideonella sp. A 288 TaxID=1962181 RepID=UPI000B4AD586|nr:GNAT family N-acetyltransferase [Ideonella sp. A 288]